VRSGSALTAEERTCSTPRADSSASCLRLCGTGRAQLSARNRDRGGFARQLLDGTDGGGLDLVRADGTVVKVFRHDARDPGTLPANTVYALAIDARDRVWVATDGGRPRPGARLRGGTGCDPFQVLSARGGLVERQPCTAWWRMPLAASG